MSSFSAIACYSALSVCSKEDVIAAYARMVASIVQEKRYDKCDPNVLCADFEAMYGFPVPYHPMKTIMEYCAHLKFFTYNAKARAFFPIYDNIDKEDFINVVKQKDVEYKKLLDSFSAFLVEQHSMHCAKEDLDERIRAFIERYGIKSKTDRNLIHKVKDDYFFAEFLVFCEENGNVEVLDYLDDYTIGIALSEVFAYSEYPESYKSKNAKVYLDAGLLFKLFGIDSSNHTDNYIEYIKNMQRLGIQVLVFEHTILETIGVIENSKQWIGNPDYDATLASETTYYFVTNNWTVEQIDELSVSIRTRLWEDFNIQTDNMPYPAAEDIHTPYEASIRDMIVQIYKENDPNIDTEEKSRTIDQDARSIFYTYYKNNNMVACHVDDVQNIFITTNRSLAKVGYRLSRNIAQSKDVFIPGVMNDIKWGTLVWFNSPAQISSINRPRLMSAAYAAFRPNDELVKKLNNKLIQMEAAGKITPEQCYLLKVNPIAQKLLAQKTMNDPDRFVDATPLEILKELSKEAYAQGSASRQAEVDKLSEENEVYKKRLAIEKQKGIISKLEQQHTIENAKIAPIKDRVRVIKKELAELDIVKTDIDGVVNRNLFILKTAIIITAIIIVGFSFYVAIKHSLIVGIIMTVWPIPAWFITFLFGKKITYDMIKEIIEKRTREKQGFIRRYSESHVKTLKNELDNLTNELNDIEDTISNLSMQIEQEKATLNALGVDASLLEGSTK
ncbi:MAG: hypothetical protein IKK41_02715 [Oscillospiraceae bacterium]|nr:hypothetical protein [Oscillospiraceae bacterium]